MDEKRIKDLKQGDLFCLKNYDNPTDEQIYIRGYYERFSKKYECYKYSDINAERFFDGNKIVYVL